MIKMMSYYPKKAGMTREEFIDYYESRHAPMVKAAFPQLVDYRRSYVRHDDLFVPTVGEYPKPPRPPFDVVTESWFKDRKSWEDLRTRMSDPKFAEPIAKDEANFLDRSLMVMFLVDEKSSFVDLDR